MTASISVITPSRPDRSHLLAQAQASVEAQTLPPLEHLCLVDDMGMGPAAIRNLLITRAQGEWLAFLDDDDLIDPRHLAVLYARHNQADVIIPYCRFNGPALPRGYYNRPFNRTVLARHGIFPITVLARKRSVVDAGMFPRDARYEDWELWNRMADNGARFLSVAIVTWTYTTLHDTERRTVVG